MCSDMIVVGLMTAQNYDPFAVVLEAQVAVAPDHPSTVPVMALALRWEGLHYISNVPQLRVSSY